MTELCYNKCMKTLLVNGSPDKDGNTATALAEVAKTLNAEGIETENFWIGTQPVRGCVACCTCRDKTPGRCVFADDAANALATALASADAFVVGSPVYYGQPNGALLALLQRAFFLQGGTKSLHCRETEALPISNRVCDKSHACQSPAV